VASAKKLAEQKKHHTTPLFPEYTFDNLVLGSANQVAAAASRQIAEKIGSSPYNPFIIYGESGLGKTHLMQAAGHLALEKNPNAKIIYVPLMDFVRNITTSLRHNTIENVKLFYQSADLLLVDDIHLIAGKDKSQEEFFHIFNFLFSTKKQIIFTCDQPPKNIKDLENRLKTRFSQGLNLQLSPPELEMRAAILLKKSQNTQISLGLSEDIALFIASHVVSNVRDLEGALLKLKAFVDFSRIDHSFITKDVVEGALGDLIKPQKRFVEINEVQKTVSKYYGITVSDLVSNSRRQHLVRARQMAIYLCHNLTSLSLAKIGQNFGNRDHSTVLYSCEKLRELMKTNEEIKNDIENIKIKITNL
jgi:chromosomal replication initiator protein